MFFILFILWLIFNGKVTLEICIFGILLSALVYGFVCKFMDWSPKKDLRVFRLMGFFLTYVIVLIIEIVKANLATLKMTFSVRYEREPVLVTFDTKIKTPFLQVLLANSITLTPGTITVSLIDGTYKVHALDKDFAVGIDDSVFVKMLEKAERMLEEHE